MTRRSVNRVNIYDYPEHLNPFHEDDNHTKLRFWYTAKKKTRSNSFSFQSIKDLKQSLFSFPRHRSGTSNSLTRLSCYRTNRDSDEFSRSDEKRRNFLFPTLQKLGRSFSIRNRKTNSLNRSSENLRQDDDSLRHSSSSHNSSIADRPTVTPLPRMRFQERVKSPEYENSDLARAETTEDSNPFKDETESNLPSTSSQKPASPPPRRKKRAPPPPPVRQSSLTHIDLPKPVIKITQEQVQDKSEDNVQVNTEIRTEKSEEFVENKNDSNENNLCKDEANASENDDNCSNDGNDDTNIEDIKTEIFENASSSDTNLSSSEISISSETKLEQKQKEQAKEDSSDLLELVQKLQLEVEKLTDDTNNNVITTEKRANFYGSNDIDPISPSKINAELTININNDNNNEDDDEDVITVSTPKLVRLRKDNEWIKH